MVEHRSTLTCPACGHAETVEMPEDYCLVRWDCPGCGAELRPAAGDCCVFCTHGDVPCPPVQAETGCCEPAR